MSLRQIMAERQNLIERFYDIQEFPDDEKSVYNNAYYAFIDVHYITPDEAKRQYPWILDPMKEQYKYALNDMSMLTAKIFDSADQYALGKMIDIAEERASFGFDDFEKDYDY